MEGKKTKEQLLNELIEMQKFIEQKVEDQDRFINRFQMLIQNEGLFSQVIDNLPYPIAIFDHSGILRMANKALLIEANISTDEISEGRINLFNRITNENYPVLEAGEDVFLGETTVLKNLVESLSLFSRGENCAPSANFQTAVFFPVVESSGRISHGAVMFMK
jgi:hypothetical protein